MKKRSRLFLSVITVLALLLTACGGSQPAETQAPETEAKTEAAAPETEAPAETAAPETQAPAETAAPETEATAETAAPETEAAKVFPVEGVYTMFAMENMGDIVESEGMGSTSVITLEEGGVGNMTMDEDSMPITSWTESDGVITITMEDGSVADAELLNGVLKLDVMGTGEIFMYMAQEGADTSVVNYMTVEEFRAKQASGGEVADTKVGALYSSMDPETGIHIVYNVKTDYLDSDQDIEVHARAGSYYSLQTTRVYELESTDATVLLDGKAYNLDPAAMTGTFVTETTASPVVTNAAMMDSLYQAIAENAVKTDLTEETREFDGVSYDAVIVPETDEREECVFYFNPDGSLAAYFAGAYKDENLAGIGTSTYRITSIDSSIDESLFDISGYEITDLDDLLNETQSGS